MEKQVQFKNGNGLMLRGFVHEPKEFDTVIVFLHGFPADSKYIVSTRIGPSLETLGYLVLRFDFGGTDTSEGKLEDKRMSKDTEDVKYAIDFLAKKYGFRKLVIVGHSSGAVNASLYAHRDKRVDGIVLLGGVGNLSEAVHYDFTDEQVRDFWTKGYITYNNPAKKWIHKKRLPKAFYDEYFTLDVLGSLHRFKRPVLIIHGEEDRSVPVWKDPIELFQAANEPKKLVIVKAADHKFTKSSHWKKVISLIDRFARS